MKRTKLYFLKHEFKNEMKTVLITIKSLLKHELISGSTYLFIGGIVANIFNFLFNLFLARSLSYSDYATFASLISLTVMLSLPSSSLTTVFIRFATDYFSKEKKNQAVTLYFAGTKIVIVIGILFLVASIISAPFLAPFLRLTNYWYIIMAGVIVSISYISIINSSFLSGLLKFGTISLFTVLGTVIKLFCGVLLILLGWRVYGALGALFFSSLLPFIFSFFVLRSIFSTKQKSVKINFKQLLFYALPASITLISLSSLISTDVILVKHFFSPENAGIYAGLALVARVIFYFTAPITAVMFPLLIKRFNKGENVHGLLYLSVSLVFITSIAISIFYFLFPKFAIGLFLGGRKYLSTYQILGFFGIYISLFSVVNVLVNFFLSLNKIKVAYIIASGAILQITLIQFFHNTFLQIVLSSSLVTLLLLIGLLIYYGKVYGQDRKKTKKINLSYNPGI